MVDILHQKSQTKKANQYNLVTLIKLVFQYRDRIFRPSDILEKASSIKQCQIIQYCLKRQMLDLPANVKNEREFLDLHAKYEEYQRDVQLSPAETKDLILATYSALYPGVLVDLLKKEYDTLDAGRQAEIKLKLEDTLRMPWKSYHTYRNSVIRWANYVSRAGMDIIPNDESLSIWLRSLLGVGQLSMMGHTGYLPSVTWKSADAYVSALTFIHKNFLSILYPKLPKPRGPLVKAIGKECRTKELSQRSDQSGKRSLAAMGDLVPASDLEDMSKRRRESRNDQSEMAQSSFQGQSIKGKAHLDPSSATISETMQANGKRKPSTEKEEFEAKLADAELLASIGLSKG